MATDYDAPRKTDEELAEDTFAELCEQTVAMPLGAPKGKV